MKLEPDSWLEHNRYRLLLEITDTVARASSLPDAFRELAQPVLALTGGELLNLSLYDARRDCMLNRYWKKNQESGEFEDSPVDKVATGWAWKHQEPIAILDIEREQRFPGCMSMLLDHGVRSYTVLPMSTPSSRFGALALGKKVPETLNEEDIEFLSRVALMGALALVHKSLQEIPNPLNHGVRPEQVLVEIAFAVAGFTANRREQCVIGAAARTTAGQRARRLDDLL